MKDILENKLSMALTTQLAMNDNAPLWNSIPAMVSAVNALGTTIAQIQSVRSIQEQDIRGIPIDKEKNKQLAINAALPIIGALKSFARANNNNALLHKINYNRSQMEKARDTVLPAQLKIVKDEATAVIPALADYNITSPQINAFSGTIAAYEVMIPKPRAALNIKKNATDSLTLYFRQINQPLIIMDGIMETLKPTQLAFYQTYRNARIIIDLAGPSTGVQGTITDKLTGSPLENVLVTINTPLVFEKIKPVPVTKFRTAKTNPDGFYEMKKIKPGNYTLTFTKIGYNSLTIQSIINEGAMTDTDAAIERNP